MTSSSETPPAVTGYAGERSARDEPSNPDSPMTQTQDQARAVEAKSLGEKLFDANATLTGTGFRWRDLHATTQTDHEKVALVFAASLSHDETASATIAALTFERDNLAQEVGEWKRNANDAEQTIAAQAEEIKRLKGALAATEHAANRRADRISTLSTCLAESEARVRALTANE